ncbi:hypothetical protein IAQ61_011939 [Plenodomus lingam]|uniref:uncharacterized protein n=1 Tax=Leptosphaeria maculans TaxID=5022 RepID=UPI003323CD42|nr:hypothetical protein IAQ61_011939 [Plenodomus lingam]
MFQNQSKNPRIQDLPKGEASSYYSIRPVEFMSQAQIQPTMRGNSSSERRIIPGSLTGQVLHDGYSLEASGFVSAESTGSQAQRGSGSAPPVPAKASDRTRNANQERPRLAGCHPCARSEIKAAAQNSKTRYQLGLINHHTDSRKSVALIDRGLGGQLTPAVQAAV